MNRELLNRAAEEAVLGSMLHERKAITAAAGALQAHDFYVTSHQILFRALTSPLNLGDPIDLTLVREELTKRGEFDQAGGALELVRLKERVPSGSNVTYHASIVRDYSHRRHLRDEANRIVTQAEDLQCRTDEVLATIKELSASSLSFTDRVRHVDCDTDVRFRSIEELAAEVGAEVGAEIEFLVAALIALEAVTLLVAKPKTGKSTLIFALVAALEHGSAFLDRAVTPTTAVILSEEGGPTLIEKARLFGVTQARVLTRAELGHCADFATVIALATAEMDRCGARVLIVDTFAAWARLGPEAEKDAGAIQVALAPLLAAASKGRAVIVTHHSKKGDAPEGDSVRGSSAIFAGVDTLIELRRTLPAEPESPGRSLTVISRFKGLQPTQHIELRGGAFVVVDGPSTSRKNDDRERVLAALRAEPSGLTRDDVQSRTSIRKQAVGRVLAALEKDGLVEKTGRGQKGSPHRFSIKLGAAADSGSPFQGEEPGTASAADRGDSVPGSGNLTEPGTGEAAESRDSVPGSENRSEQGTASTSSGGTACHAP